MASPGLLGRASTSSLIVSSPTFRTAVVASPWFEPTTASATAVNAPRVLSPSSVRSAAQEAFFRSDTTRSGWLTLYEFRSAMRQLGFSLSDPSTVHFFRDIDTEGLGKINLDQFVNWYSSSWRGLASMVSREEGVPTLTLYDRLSSSESENRILRDEVNSLKAKLNEALSRAADADSLASRLHDVASEAQAGRAAISDLNKQVGSLSVEAIEASRLRSEVAAAHETIARVRGDLHDSQAAVGSLKQRLADTEDRLQSAEAAARNSEKERLQAIAEREYTTGEVRALEVRVRALESQISEKLHELEQSRKVEQELLARAQRLEEEVAESQNELRQANSLLRHSENKLGKALLAEQILSDKLVNHEQMLVNLREALTNQSGDLERTKKALDQSQDNLTAIRHEKIRLEGEIGTLNESLAARLGELQQQGVALSSAKSRIAILESNLDTSNREIQVHNDTIERLRANIIEFQQRVPNLEHTIGELHGKVLANDAIIPNLQRALGQVAHLEAANAELNAQYSQARAALDAIYSLPDPCGVGLKIEDGRDGLVRVTGFVEDMSAERSGAVAVGDVIRAIGDTEVSGMTVQKVRDLILGPRGSYVAVTLSRAGTQDRFVVQLRRGSYGPEFQVVSSETKDGPASGSGRPVDAPVNRRSTNLVTM